MQNFNCHVFNETYIKDGKVIHDQFQTLTSTRPYQDFMARATVHPDKPVMWVNIPKNFSNSINEELLHLKWNPLHWSATDLSGYRAVAFMRDPMHRFRGCVLETLRHLSEDWQMRVKKELTEYKDWKEFFEANIKPTYSLDRFADTFDVHFIPQYSFFMGLDVNQIDLHFSLDTVKDFPTISKKMNVTSDCPVKSYLAPWVDEMLSDVNLQNKVKDFYRKDYEIIEKGFIE